MVKISHFKHDHPPIILEEAPKSDSRNITCYGCHKQLSWAGESAKGNVYGCATCGDFFVHESCVQLPKEIRHLLVEGDSFLLRTALDSKDPVCILCRQLTAVAPIYSTQLDSNNVLHVKCVFTEKEKYNVVVLDHDLTLNHPSHKHDTLRLIPRLASIRCDANCESEHVDFSYLCSSCPFWIHRLCALLPPKTEWGGHDHPLTLSFGLPIEYHNYKYYCDLCDNYINTTDKTPIWLYCCYLCRYFVHHNCMIPQHLENHDSLDSASSDKDLLRLPAADISMELIRPFSLRENLNAFANVESEIKFASHQQHPLILSYKQIFEHMEDEDEEILCDACIEPILSPLYYHCTKCRYFLHFHCANLPSKLEHSSHLHPLSLGYRRRFYDDLKCNLCGKYSNGFFFSCQVEECRFHIDIKCAALPSFIKHETYKHPLHHSRTKLKFRDIEVQELILAFRTCKGCHKDPEDTNYYFEFWSGRRFYLHERCAMLPKRVRHRFDSHHPLRLRFPPHFYHPSPFDCAECETEIHPKHWLYHCEECDLSFHTYCVNRTGIFDNFKCGQKLEIDIHPHPLKFVRKASVNSPCQHCGVDINKDLSFECETCNFHLCRGCVMSYDS